jgi:N-acetylglucosaminyl-diphospho-decaprenol L-rhamnosyltransferase
MSHAEVRMVTGQVPRVGVVIVAFNSAQQLPALIGSLPDAAPGIDLEVVVVDNASTDDSVAVCAGLGITCVPTGVNGGYARAINVGARYLTGCDALLICNPDLRWEPGAIARMWDGACRSGGVVVPMLCDDSGGVARSQRRHPSILGQFGEALLGDRWGTRPAIFTEIVRDPGRYAAAHHVDWATGAALLVHRACVERVGPWDEDYFLFSEEVDYMVRSREGGFPIVFWPEAIAVHEEGGSGRSTPLLSLVGVNKLRYYGRRHGPVATALYGLGVLLQLALRAADPTHRNAVGDVARALWPAMRRRLPPACAPIPAAVRPSSVKAATADG